MMNNMQRAIVLERLPVPPQGFEVNDPNDAFLVTMALAGEANYLVTGDRRAGLRRAWPLTLTQSPGVGLPSSVAVAVVSEANPFDRFRQTEYSSA